MATGDNAILPLFDEADSLTGAVTATVSAGHFVNPSGNFQAGPALDVSTPTSPLTGGNLIQVAHATAAGPAIGVAKWDAVGAGDVVGIGCEGIWPVVSSGAIAAGAEVEVGAGGVAVTIAAGKSCGIAVSAAAGNIVYVKLFR